jgi:HK97 family phage prohead protease
MLFEYKSTIADSLKDVDTGKRELVGMFANYETRDMVGDLSTKGMFTKTWAEQKARVKHVHEHDMSSPIGKIQDLWEDTKGAYYRSKVPKGKDGDKWLEWAEGGLLDEHSFGYKTVRARPAGKGQRDLLEVKHFEVTSVSGWVVHGDTPLLTVKKSLSLDEVQELTAKMEKRHRLFEKMIRNSSATDETIEEFKDAADLLLLEIKSLQQHIINLSTSSTHAAISAPEPQTEGFDVKSLLAVIEIEKQKFLTV